MRRPLFNRSSPVDASNPQADLPKPVNDISLVANDEPELGEVSACLRAVKRALEVEPDPRGMRPLPHEAEVRPHARRYQEYDLGDRDDHVGEVLYLIVHLLSAQHLDYPAGRSLSWRPMGHDLGP